MTKCGEAAKWSWPVSGVFGRGRNQAESTRQKPEKKSGEAAGKIAAIAIIIVRNLYKAEAQSHGPEL